MFSSNAANPKTGFISLFSKKQAEAAQRARTNSFLNALPYQFCAFCKDGSIIHSPLFLKTMQIDAVRTLADLQMQLGPSDAAALESLIARLEERGIEFTLDTTLLKSHARLRFKGVRGQDDETGEQLIILFVEDNTENLETLEALKNATLKQEQDISLYKAFLESQSYPVWIKNAEGRIIACNQAYADAAALSVQDIITQQKSLPFTAPKNKNASNTPIKELSIEALKLGQVLNEKRHLIIKGQRRLMDITLTPVTDLNITIAKATDITLWEEQETEKLRNAAAQHELLEQLRSAIAMFGADQKLEFHNTAFSQLWQIDDQFLNSKPKLGDILERLRENRKLPEQADFKKYKHGWLEWFTSLIRPHEDMLYLPDGTVLRMLVVPHPLGGLMMTFEDVTSRLELELSYNTLVAVQRETLDNLAEGVAAFGGDGRMRLCNPSFARLWSLNPEDLEGQPHISRLVDRMKAFASDEDWPEIRDNLTKQALQRDVSEGRIERADETVIEFSTLPLPDGGVLVTHFDITDTIRVENALREKNVALETAEKLKLEFLANVSYQLRTPLNAIIGFNEILDKEYFGPLNDRQKEYTKGLGEAGERLMNLINDILDLSSIEAGYLTLVKSETDIAELLSSVINLTQEWARGQKIEILREFDEHIGSINIDERRLKQVLLNLIRNAIEFTPAGGTIKLAARKTDDNMIIEVIDTGRGIAPEDQQRVFKPFEKTKTKRENVSEEGKSSAGLGLTLVKNIIELHGGHVGIQSTEGTGTRITLDLPTAPRMKM